MKIQVLFFGATANTIGQRSVEKSLPDGSTAKMAFDELKSQFPQLTTHKLLYSLNQSYADGDEIVRDGDEFAIFTAVSGG